MLHPICLSAGLYCVSACLSVCKQEIHSTFAEMLNSGQEIVYLSLTMQGKQVIRDSEGKLEAWRKPAFFSYNCQNAIARVI